MGWKIIFTPEVIEYFRKYYHIRCYRWYLDYLLSLHSDKYIVVYKSPEGHVTVERRQCKTFRSDLLIPLKAAIGGKLNMRQIGMLAKIRDCTFNKKSPWDKQMFTEAFDVTQRTTERDLEHLMSSKFIKAIDWEIWGASVKERDGESYMDMQSRRNVNEVKYPSSQRTKVKTVYAATRKARVYLGDFPKERTKKVSSKKHLVETNVDTKNNVTNQNEQSLLVNKGTEHPLQISVADYLYINKNIFDVGYQRGETPLPHQVVPTPDPIFTSVMDSLTRLESSGFPLGEDWRKQPEIYKAARFLARQEGVTEERVLAWERELATNSFLKAVLRHGWKGAIENDYAKKGSAPWNKSAHLAKYRDRQWRVKHLIYHLNDIIAGKYQRKELSEKAKGRVWGEGGKYLAPNTPLTRTEIPTEWFNGFVLGSTPQKDLRALLERLWGKYGWSTYESLIDPCEKVQDAQGRWVFEAPNGHHADLMESKLGLEWWRIVRPKTDKPSRSPMREAYNAWLKENEQHVQTEKKDGEDERVEQVEQVSRVEGEQEMGIVPANDDECIIPAYVDDDAPYQSGQMPRHMGGKTQGQNMADDGRSSEEALLKLKRERQEQLLRNVTACTNMHMSEKSLRAHTIAHYGISAYQCWFDRCQIKIDGDVARYVAPSDFVGYEIERRYRVILENYIAKGDEITARKKKERL